MHFQVIMRSFTEPVLSEILRLLRFLILVLNETTRFFATLRMTIGEGFRMTILLAGLIIYKFVNLQTGDSG